MSKKHLNMFLWSIFLVSYVWQLIIFFTGGVNSYLFPILMWIPGLVAIVFARKSKHKLKLFGWGMRKWWYLPLTVIIPLGVIVATIFILEVTNLGEWSNTMFTLHNGWMNYSRAPLILGDHRQHVAFFSVNLVISLFVQSCMGCLFTLGEELAWRGYAQERFIKRYGLNRGLLILGVIWGYWHLPVILMGYNFPNHRILGAFIMMPLSTTLMGIWLGWLYLRSQSIWIPSVTHAAINLTALILLNGTVMHQNPLFRQLIWVGVWGVVAGLCLISLRRSHPHLEKTPRNRKSSRATDTVRMK